MVNMALWITAGVFFVGSIAHIGQPRFFRQWYERFSLFEYNKWYWRNFGDAAMRVYACFYLLASVLLAVGLLTHYLR